MCVARRGGYDDAYGRFAQFDYEDVGKSGGLDGLDEHRDKGEMNRRLVREVALVSFVSCLIAGWQRQAVC
jgi:hypothetical protein